MTIRFQSGSPISSLFLKNEIEKPENEWNDLRSRINYEIDITNWHLANQLICEIEKIEYKIKSLRVQNEK